MGKEGKGGMNSYLIGIIALVFLILGYQTALFIHRAAVLKIAADRDAPDTIYVLDYAESQPQKRNRSASSNNKGGTIRHNAAHSEAVEQVRKNIPPAKVESFRFDPNEVSIEDLCRLGFSPKQAESIDNYRQKGGRFRRKEDFSKSYCVSDSIYRRLEPYIDIPQLDLNLADSAAFDALPGIGGWFAMALIHHRQALGGFSYKEQMMDVKNFSRSKFKALEDLVTVSDEYVRPYPLWTYPADSLKHHPYIHSTRTAEAIVLYRQNNPRELLTVQGLNKAGILSDEDAARLSRCRIVPP